MSSPPQYINQYPNQAFNPSSTFQQTQTINNQQQLLQSPQLQNNPNNMFNPASPPQQQQNVFHYYNNVNFNMSQQQPALSNPTYTQQNKPQQNEITSNNPKSTGQGQKNDVFYGGLVNLSYNTNSTINSINKPHPVPNVATFQPYSASSSPQPNTKSSLAGSNSLAIGDLLSQFK